MLDLKEATMEEKITHYLMNELNDDQSKIVLNEINNNPEYQKILDETKGLIDLIQTDKEASNFSFNLGEERKRKIMEEAQDNKFSRVIELFKHMKFTIAIAAGILLSVIFFPGLWEDKNVKPTIDTKSSVQGVYSFNVTLPSAKYFLTFQDGKLTIDNISPADGNDFFSKAKVKKGDVIIEINEKDTSRFESTQWKSYFFELINEKEVHLKIDRKGQKLSKKVVQ